MPVAGAQVAIQLLSGTTFVTVAGVATGADGTWSATLPLARSGTFRAFYAGDGTHRAAVSPPLPVQVRP
jgi:hypothetical protein